MKHQLRIFTTAGAQVVIELDGNIVEDADIELKMLRSGRVMANLTFMVDEIDVDVDVEPQRLVQKPGLHRFRIDYGQVFLDGHAISAEQFHMNPDKDGKTGTVDLKDVPVIFEELKS